MRMLFIVAICVWFELQLPVGNNVNGGVWLLGNLPNITASKIKAKLQLNHNLFLPAIRNHI